MVPAELRRAVVADAKSGFTAEGTLIDGVLHQGGMIRYRDGRVPRQ